MMSIDICLSPCVDVITRIELFTIDLIGKQSHFWFSEMEMEMEMDSDYIPHGVMKGITKLKRIKDSPFLSKTNKRLDNFLSDLIFISSNIQYIYSNMR